MIEDAPLSRAVTELQTGTTTPQEYLSELRERFDRIEPEIESFVAEEDRWDRIDAERERIEERDDRRPVRPPLYGVPVGVKDIFHADGMPTRAGSDVPPDALTGPEASAVTALREAGAIVFGKTVTAEFAYFEPGPTRNPHDRTRTPGGSSSGSAAAVAAGLIPLAIGTQTIGSVNRPAAFCGVVGVKPSFDRIPTGGVIPAAPSVDHVGFFTQDVSGAAIAAAVLYDEWRSGIEPPRDVPVVGAVTGPYLQQATDVGRRQFERQLDRLEAAGFDVRRLDPFDDIEAINRRHEALVAAEMALSHDEWYPEYGDRYAAATRKQIETGRSIDAGTLADARAGRGRLRAALEERMDDAGVDVLVSPAAPGPAPTGIDSTGDPIMNLPWTHAGMPSVTVPASRTDDGLPIGLQCVAPYGHDEWLLEWCDPISRSQPMDRTT